MTLSEPLLTHMLDDNFSAHPVMRKILDTIQRHQMLQIGEAVLVGVSGGPDSMALLHALLILSRKMHFTVGVAHLNHCLRGVDADNDEKFVQSAAKNLGLPVFTKKKISAPHKKRLEFLSKKPQETAGMIFFSRCAKEQVLRKSPWAINLMTMPSRYC
jgi:tRNA(Ile)-lysidine synthase